MNPYVNHTDTPLGAALFAIYAEHSLACASFHPMASPHEGWAVLLEEVDELWDEVKIDTAGRVDMAREAVQVGAMALRFLLDTIPASVIFAMAEEAREALGRSL